jgi:signal peptidase II
VRWVFLVLVTASIILFDQLTKAYVVAHLALHESWMPIDFIEPYFRFTHIHNTGAAFGMFPDSGLAFFFIALIVSSIILYYYRKLPKNVWLIRLALGLQLGGALGNNVIDRARQGYVVDFLNFEWWPVFNVADSCIVVGVALLAFEMLREEYRASRQASQADRESPGSDKTLDSSGENPSWG